MSSSAQASAAPRVESRPSPSSIVRRDGLSLSKDDEHKEEHQRRRLSEVRRSPSPSLPFWPSGRVIGAGGRQQKRAQ
jgi:hypothetical protein